ncbi:MAG TPA: endonuclease/exonuclease/phosphatase family protein [Pilimelia sp.]|nr:endonuclease/exonuclease/phosphatase family protein [Pilimelia sp.]
MSYNVHMQRDDTAALAAVVRAAEPDVLIVQEAPRRFRWRAKCARLAHSLDLVVVEGGLPSLGNLLLTNLRVRAHDTWSIRLPLTPGRHMRGAAFAVCSIGRTRFAVAGSHLSTDPYERPGQAALVRKALAEIDVPVVLGADLNETSGSPAWRTLGEGLVDVAAKCSRDDRFTFSCPDPRQRIDALFTDPRFTVRRYDVIDTPEARRASDHFPIVADLALPGS